VVKDLDAFEAYYGSGHRIAGQYSGRLSNAGERIELLDAAGRTIHDFEFKDGWYECTDGEGYSLVVIDPTGADLDHWANKEGWRPSLEIGGSPGLEEQEARSD
jgi:hypothetical protein